MSDTQNSSLATAGQHLIAMERFTNHAVPKSQPTLPPHQAHLMSHEEFVTRFGEGHFSTPSKASWVNVDKIKDRYDELCKHFQSFTAEERREMESIVVHCTALNLPVQCANMNQNQDTEEPENPEPKQRQPKKRKSVIHTSTTMSSRAATSGVLPIGGPPPSSQDTTPSGGHAPFAPARIPLKRPLDHKDPVSGTERAGPPAKRTDEGHAKQAHTVLQHHVSPAVSTQTFKPAPSGLQEKLPVSYSESVADEARQVYLAQELGPRWIELDISSKLAGLRAARHHDQLLKSGVPESSLIPVVYDNRVDYLASGSMSASQLYPNSATRTKPACFFGGVDPRTNETAESSPSNVIISTTVEGSNNISNVTTTEVQGRVSLSFDTRPGPSATIHMTVSHPDYSVPHPVQGNEGSDEQIY